MTISREKSLQLGSMYHAKVQLVVWRIMIQYCEH